MSNYVSEYVSEEFDKAMTETKVVQIDRDLGRPAIDVVYDALITKVDYYNSLIRDAELELKHWKEMKSEFEQLIKAIDRRT